jgi:hypothetical protein
MSDDERGTRRAVIFLASAVITAGVAYLAFFIGAWGFDTRRYSQHEGRLRNLVVAAPRLEVVVQALEDEGSPLVAAPNGPGELEKAAAQWAGPKAAEVMEKGPRWGQTRVFRAGDMVYFLFFDREGVLRDFTYVSR